MGVVYILGKCFLNWELFWLWETGQTPQNKTKTKKRQHQKSTVLHFLINMCAWKKIKYMWLVDNVMHNSTYCINIKFHSKKQKKILTRIQMKFI